MRAHRPQNVVIGAVGPYHRTMRPACSIPGCESTVQPLGEHCPLHATLLLRFTRWLDRPDGFDAERLVLDRIAAGRRDC
jgi:hypothetical protein